MLLGLVYSMEGEREGQGGYLEYFMVMDVNQMYCGDHFAIHTNTKSHYTPETNVMF